MLLRVVVCRIAEALRPNSECRRIQHFGPM